MSIMNQLFELAPDDPAVLKEYADTITELNKKAAFCRSTRPPTTKIQRTEVGNERLSFAV
jgi:hypothetical protein